MPESDPQLCRAPADAASAEVAVVIPTLEGERLLAACLAALAAQTVPAAEVVVVDNGGEAAAWLARHHPRVRAIAPGRNLGFAAAVNAGLAATRAPYVALLNDDARPAPGWLAALLAAMESGDRPAWVCGKVVGADDSTRLDSVGDGMSRLLLPYPIGRFERDQGQYDRCRPVLLPPGSAVLLDRALLNDVGGLEASYFAYMEDVDFGLRAALLGHHGRIAPAAVAAHVGSATTGSMINPTTVRLSTRNLLRTQVRNLPAALLVRAAPRILAGHLYWFAKMAVKEGCWIAWLRGWLGWLRWLPADLRHRRALLARRRIDNAELARRLAESAAEVTESIRRKRVGRG